MEMSRVQFLSLSDKELNDSRDILPSRKGPVLPIGSNFKESLFRFAKGAVEAYNSKNPGKQFEVIDPLHYQSAGTQNYHVSFIARSKDDSSSFELFSAEVSSSGDTIMTRKCFIVEPCNPLFVIGCDSCHPEGVIYHPFHYRNPSDLRPLEFSGSREYFAKRLLSEAYIITSYEQNLNNEDEDELFMTTYGYAWEALTLYNRQCGTCFEPVRIVASVRFGCSDPYIGGEALWVHVVFKATEALFPMTASPTYFFAELGLLPGEWGEVRCPWRPFKMFSVREDTVTCIKMGEAYPTTEGSACPGTETNCAVCRVHCPTMLVHPQNYKAGRYGGNFVDALDKEQWRTVKAKLEQKDGDSSKVARLEYLEALER